MFHKIARIVKNISFLLLSLQSEFLQKRLEKRLGYSKKTIVEGCTVDISQKSKALKEKIDLDVKGILKQLKNNPDKIIEYLENNDMKVYLIKNAENVLYHISEKEGFITERSGYSAIVLNRLIGNGFKLKTKPMIVFSEELDIYKLIRALYNWYSMREGLKGFDSKSQKLLQKMHEGNEDDIIARLSLTEIESLRNAINRDVQAIEFVNQYAKENAGAKNALKKMQDEGGANI